MTELTDPTATGLDQPSPGDDLAGNGADSRGTKRPRTSMAGDDDDDDDEKGGRERRKIEIKFITDKSRRHITFSKRKAGIMKKACHYCHLSSTVPLTYTGLRTLSPHRYSSLVTRSFRDRSCVYFHHT